MKMSSLQHGLGVVLYLLPGGFLLPPVQAQTNIAAGDVSGTWALLHLEDGGDDGFEDDCGQEKVDVLS